MRLGTRCAISTYVLTRLRRVEGLLMLVSGAGLGGAVVSLVLGSSTAGLAVSLSSMGLSLVLLLYGFARYAEPRSERLLLASNRILLRNRHFSK